MLDATTTRILELLEDARSSLLQAQYEGSHIRRQEPRPASGSPWDTPDTPLPVARVISLTLDNLDSAIRLGRATQPAGRHT